MSNDLYVYLPACAHRMYFAICSIEDAILSWAESAALSCPVTLLHPGLCQVSSLPWCHLILASILSPIMTPQYTGEALQCVPNHYGDGTVPQAPWVLLSQTSTECCFLLPHHWQCHSLAPVTIYW